MDGNPIAHVIELYFDAASEATIRAIWDDLGAAGLRPAGATGQSRPHVSLAVYGMLDVPAAGETLAALARQIAPFPLTLALIGCFPPSAAEAVLFYGPTVTPALLALHERVEAALAVCASAPWDYYRPGRWVPHCTLTERCPPERLGEAIAIARQLPLPATCHVEEIGIIAIRPVQPLITHRFGDR